MNIVSDIRILQEGLQANIVEIERLKADARQLNYDVGSIMSSQLMLEEGINQLNHTVEAIVDFQTQLNMNVEKVAEFQLVLSHDLATMREDIVDLKGDMATMREDMAAMKEMLMRSLER
jgi:hypothetical protein